MAIKRDVQLCAKLRPHEAEAVKALADRQGVTISELIRDALHLTLFEGAEDTAAVHGSCGSCAYMPLARSRRRSKRKP